jgi:hypothetical protein
VSGMSQLTVCEGSLDGIEDCEGDLVVVGCADGVVVGSNSSVGMLVVGSCGCRVGRSQTVVGAVGVRCVGSGEMEGE